MNQGRQTFVMAMLALVGTISVGAEGGQELEIRRAAPTLGFNVFGTTIRSAIYPLPKTKDPLEEAALPASEPGREVSFTVYLANSTNATFTVKQYLAKGDLQIQLRRIGGAKQLAFDPIAEMDKRIALGFTGLERSPATDKDFVPLAPNLAVLPGRSVTYRDVKTKVGGVASPMGNKIPARLIQAPGVYEIYATYKNTDKRGWTGTLRSKTLQFEVLSRERIAQLENGLKLTRQQVRKAIKSALIKQQQQIIAYQKETKTGYEKASLTWKEPQETNLLRLWMYSEKSKTWHASFYALYGTINAKLAGDSDQVELTVNQGMCGFGRIPLPTSVKTPFTKLQKEQKAADEKRR